MCLISFMLFSKRFSKSYLSTKERPKLLARVRVATFALWIFQHSFLDRDTLGGFFFFKSIFFASSPTYFCPASAFFRFAILLATSCCRFFQILLYAILHSLWILS